MHPPCRTGGDVALDSWTLRRQLSAPGRLAAKWARSSPATEIESELSSAWLAERIVVISQLADELDRSTLDSRYESSWCSGVRNDSAPVDSSDENRRSGSEALILKLMS